MSQKLPPEPVLRLAAALGPEELAHVCGWTLGRSVSPDRLIVKIPLHADLSWDDAFNLVKRAGFNTENTIKWGSKAWRNNERWFVYITK